MSYNNNASQASCQNQGPRLPYPGEEAQKREISEQDWNALVTNIFSNAKQPSAILFAVDTAKSKGLDVFKGHFAIVAQRQQINGQWVDVEVVWPTLKSLVFTAHRTNAFAGMDPVEYGPIVDGRFTGSARNRDTGRNEDKTVQLKYPEWARATVYRFVQGTRCPFTATVYFEETASFKYGLPVGTWLNKPRFMIQKNATSAALRLAFAECDFSAEEMDGKTIGSEAEVLSFPANAESDQQTSPDQQTQTGAPAADKQQGEPDEPVTQFTDVDDNTMRWLAGTCETAISTGAYAPALSNLRASLEPRYHQIGEALLNATKVAATCGDNNVLAWLGTTIQQLPKAYPQAVKHVFDQKDRGNINQDVAFAMELVLTFHSVLSEKNLAAA